MLQDSKPGEIDLHGLYVKEAIAYTDKSIQEARQRGDSSVHLIVGQSPHPPLHSPVNDRRANAFPTRIGKGLHSPQHAAKLKPAIEELMQKYVVH